MQPTVAGTFPNTATRTSQDQPDPNPSNDSGTASVMVGLVGDLSITKTDNLVIAVAGQDITYEIVVENAGPSPIANARVTDTFPSVLTGVSWTCTPDPGSFCAPPSLENPAGVSAGGGNIDVPIALLPDGGRVVFAVNGALSPDAGGDLVNTARVTPPPDVTDPDPSNNVATDTTEIEQQANLEIVKTGPAAVVAGQTIVYTITVLNAGPSTATDVVVDDPPPADLTFVSNSGDCTTAFPCALGTLAPGDQRVITSTYTVLPGSGVARVTVNTATVASPTPDPNPENNTSSVETTIAAGTTTSTSTTTSTPGSTTTTTTIPGELCGNCLDDDGDGMIDFEDADCCTEIGTLTVTKVKTTPRRGTPTRGKLRVIGTLTGAGFDAFDPRQEEVSVTLGDGTPVVCCTVPQMKWRKLFRRHYGFWDQKGMTVRR